MKFRQQSEMQCIILWTAPVTAITIVNLSVLNKSSMFWNLVWGTMKIQHYMKLPTSDQCLEYKLLTSQKIVTHILAGFNVLLWESNVMFNQT